MVNKKFKKSVKEDLSPEYPFNSHYFQTSTGYKLHYIDEGGDKGSDQVLVCVHGNPTWSYYFRNVVRFVSNFQRVVAIDHLGMGLSDRIETRSEFTLKKHSERLGEFIQDIVLGNSSNSKGKKIKIDLLVHDWGGPIGLLWGVYHLNLLDRIIITNTAAFLSEDIPKRINLCRGGLRGRFLIEKLNLFSHFANLSASVKKLSKGVKKGFLYPYEKVSDRFAQRCFVEDIPLETDHVSYEILSDLEQKLPLLLNKDVYLLWGGKDFCFHDSFFERWQKILPNAKTKYKKNAGHYLFEDTDVANLLGFMAH